MTKNGDYGRKNIRRLIQQKNPVANITISRVLLYTSLISVIVWVVFRVGLLSGNDYLINVSLLGGAALMFGAYIVCMMCGGKGTWVKYILFASLVLFVFSVNITVGFFLEIAFALPIMLSCRYYDKHFTLVLFALCSILLVLTAYINTYSGSFVGIIDLGTVRFAQKTTVSIDGFMYDEIIPLVEEDDMLRYSLLLRSAPNIIVLSVFTVAALFIIDNNEKNIIEFNNHAEQNAELEIKLNEMKTRMVISQIQPHFLYNTLSAIMAIDGNPDETVDSLGEFGKYLRENISSLTSENLIPISSELAHVRRYLSLEKLRFGDRLRFEIIENCDEFLIPPLSVQMIAENAVRHGISDRKEGGAVRICTDEDENDYTVTVTDDGVGFDPEKLKFYAPEDDHVGLSNARQRLASLCLGRIEIESEIGKGSRVTIIIPKNKNG